MTETQVIIQDVAFGGSGVGRLPDGQVVFVPRTLTGETVRIRLGRVRKGFAEAELIEVLAASPHRMTPPCVYFGRCGGCAYQHATYDEQLRIKEKQLRDTLMRIGGFQTLPPIHVEAAASPLGYRNKIVLHRDEKNRLGFYATDHRHIVDIERCLIASDRINERLAAVRKDPAGPYRGRKVILSDPGDREDVPRESFHQVNSTVAGKLLEWLRNQIFSGGTERSPHLLDLYCGAGFFTLGLADSFSDVCGMDRDTRAIHLATARAPKAGVSHARFFAADIEEKIDWILESRTAGPFVLLVDPTREGLPRRVMESLARCGRIASLIYISCNPATLARDLKRFLQIAEQAFPGKKPGLHRLALFDMFPQTAHIEAVAILGKTT